MTEKHDSLNDIAIIGMDARVPGANNVEEFWEILRAGAESTKFFGGDPQPLGPGMAHVKAAPVLEGVEMFDAGLFGFNPREAATMDPQVRFFLESAWTALRRQRTNDTPGMPCRHLFALAVTKSMPSSVIVSRSPKSELIASIRTRRPSWAATRAISATGLRSPVVVSWCTTTTWLSARSSRSAPRTSSARAGVVTSYERARARIPWARAIRRRRSP